MAHPWPVEIRLLGRFAVLRDGAEVPPAAFGGRKVRSLIKVLATRPGQFVSNDVLTDALWPTRAPADPVANLQVLVNRARKALGDPGTIRTGQGGYSLTTTSTSVDADRFAQLAEAQDLTPEGLREALALWRGSPLPEEVYDDWATDYCTRLSRLHHQVLHRAAGAALASGDADGAVELIMRVTDTNPLDETAVILLMRSLGAAGQGAAALTVYDAYRRELADQLGVDPSPGAAQLHQQFLAALPASAGSDLARRRRPGTLGDLPFVGRSSELDLVRAELAHPRRHASVVVVEGPSGTGKSRFLESVAAQVPLARARAWVSERAEPWSFLRTLLRELLAEDLGHADGLPAPMAEALGWLLPELAPTSASSDPESRRLLMHEVALRVAGSAGVAIAADDLQWCDPSSLGVVASLVRRGTTPIVLAFRPDEVKERPDVVELLAHCDVAVGVALGGLPEGSLRDLVPDADLRAVLVQRTDRTPMAVTEVLRALVSEGLAVTEAGAVRAVAPGAIERAGELARSGQRRAIAERVGRRPMAEQRLLALLALMARETDAQVLLDATGASQAELHDLLGRLLRKDLVRVGERGWATSHDMVTEVVVAELDAAAAVGHHADLARALSGGDDPALLGDHRRAAGDIQGAVAAWTQAAANALAGFALDEATRLVDRALELMPAARAASALHEIRGEARQHRGDLHGARDDLQEALRSCPPGAPRSRILARLAMLASGADDLVRASQLAEQAIVESGADRATRARALEVGSVLDVNLDLPERAHVRAAESLALYEELGDAPGMARVIDARAMALFLDGEVARGEVALRRAADLFEDSGDLVHVLTPRSTSGHALVFAGRPDDGLRSIDRSLDLARNLAHAEGQAYALWHRTEALAALGRGEEAAADAAEALSIATRIGHRGWTATAWRAVGIAAQQRGALDRALDAFRRSLDLSDHLDLFASWAAARAALLLVTMNDLAEASTLTDHALAIGPPLGHYEARWARVELAAARGDDDAAALARDALRRMEAGGVRQGEARLHDVMRAGRQGDQDA